jgi:hypothetical protein
MGVSAIAGAVVGGVLQSAEASRARGENRRQQRRALSFQEKQVQRGEKAIEEAFKFSRESLQAQAKRASREADAALAARGYDPAGTIGLGAKRAIMSDTASNVQQLYQNIAQMKVANLQGQSYPMITESGPKGNWGADFARLAMMSQGGGGGFTPIQLGFGGFGQQVAGQALSDAGLGFFGMPMQMAGSSMTSAAMGGE